MHVHYAECSNTPRKRAMNQITQFVTHEWWVMQVCSPTVFRAVQQEDVCEL